MQKIKTNIFIDKVKLYFKTIMDLSDRIDNHHLYMLAAGIAFNITLYLIPMFLVAIYMVNIFIDPTYLAQILEKTLIDLLPPNESSMELLHQIIEEVKKINLHSSVAGWIGIFSLLWISSALISSFRLGLNAIFNIQAKKIFIIYRIKDIGLTIILTVLVLLYSYFVPLINFVISFLENIIPDIIHTFVSNAILALLSLATSFMLYLFIYYFVPTKRLPKKVVIYSTMLNVALTELSRQLFAWYISSFADYGKFYGTYAVLISMAVWIYYSSFILLFSAETVNFFFERNADESIKPNQKVQPIHRKKNKKS